MTEKKRILVVDDDDTITRVLHLFIEAGGQYLVQTVNDSRKAVKIAAEFKPHLAILDIVMPEIDGGELAARFAEHPTLKDVPVIFLTALVKEVELGTQGKTIGGHPFLAKPVEPDEILSLIGRTLKG